MSDPKPNETWIDTHPMTDRREWRDKTRFRRVVTVTEFSPHGRVEGLSAWQERDADGWGPVNYPPPRKTRILAHVFVKRFVRAEES